MSNGVGVAPGSGLGGGVGCGGAMRGECCAGVGRMWWYCCLRRKKRSYCCCYCYEGGLGRQL